MLAHVTETYWTTCGEQNIANRSKVLVGTDDPREIERCQGAEARLSIGRGPIPAMLRRLTLVGCPVVKHLFPVDSMNPIKAAFSTRTNEVRCIHTGIFSYQESNRKKVPLRYARVDLVLPIEAPAVVPCSSSIVLGGKAWMR